MALYFTSDTHFSHKNIIEYCSNTRGRFILEDGEPDIISMNEAIVKLWNDTVSEDDTVLFLGDWAMRVQEMYKYVSRLNGKILAIRGNHDHKVSGLTDKKGAQIDTKFWHPMVFNDSTRALLIHSPYDLSKVPPDVMKETNFVLCGHVHNLWKYKKPCDVINAYITKEHQEPEIIAPLPIINVGLDAWEFKMVTSEDIELLLKEINNGKKA